MNLSAESVLFSWALEPVPALGLAVTAIIYFLGWRRLHAQVPGRFPVERLLSFFGGLAVIYVAIASPLDAFAGWLLIVHMVQHLLLTMVAPPLLLLGWPMLPMLTGLPRGAVREGLAPFLNAPALHRLGRFLVHPMFTLPLFMLSNVIWHTPALYDLALRSPTWHQTEHLSFLLTAILFWWPVVQPWPSRPAFPRWAMIPYLLIADLQNTALSGFLSFSGGVFYQTYALAPRISSLSAAEDQAGAGAVMWVPGSMAFLIPAGIIAMSCLSSKRRRYAEAVAPRTSAVLPRQPFDLLRVPVLGWFLVRCRPLVQASLFFVAMLVVADGLLGPQVSPINLAGVAPWIHWSAIVGLGLLIVGNTFCYACPFTFVRDIARKILPASHTWPRALRSKWFAVALVAGFFFAYEILDLWDRPWWTAWIVVFYFVAALVVDGFFKNASYCKYVCPIGQFQFVLSLVSPMEVRVRQPDICATCRTRDCIRGNESQRGCELLLYQPRKSGNMDCTFCMDCVKACPHDNIGLLHASPARDVIDDPRRSSIGSFARRPDLAALILVVVFGAFANMASMVSPVSSAQAAVVRMIGPHLAMLVWLVVFVLAVLILPQLITALCGWLSARAAGSRNEAALAQGFVPGLIPLGFAMWLCHTSFHIFSGILSPFPILLRMAGDLGLPVSPPEWNLAVPIFGGLPAIQILLLNAGLLFSLWIFWNKSQRLSMPPQPALQNGHPSSSGSTGVPPVNETGNRKPETGKPGLRADASGVPPATSRAPLTLPIFLPWAILATALYALGLWLIFQPFDMPLTMP